MGAFWTLRGFVVTRSNTLKPSGIYSDPSTPLEVLGSSGHLGNHSEAIWDLLQPFEAVSTYRRPLRHLKMISNLLRQIETTWNPRSHAEVCATMRTPWSRSERKNEKRWKHPIHFERWKYLEAKGKPVMRLGTYWQNLKTSGVLQRNQNPSIHWKPRLSICWYPHLLEWCAIPLV